MKRIDGQPILTAAQMRAAEAYAMIDGTTVSDLMERAGRSVADAVRRLAAGAPVLVLCGPGKNGGDGYIAARILKAHGVNVRVAAAGGEPKGEDVSTALRAWGVPVEALPDAPSAPVLVDALFGTGMSRPLDEPVAVEFGRLMRGSRLNIAVDLPSHVVADTGEVFDDDHVGKSDVTLALGAVKPAHVLMPSAEYCGHVRLLDIGVSPATPFVPLGHYPHVIERPVFLSPDQADHKYSRGLVIVIAGQMPGAARLAAKAAARAGAGYVIVLGDDAPPTGLPDAIVRREWSREALALAIEGKSNVAILVGPGLGRDEAAREKLAATIATGRKLVVDGDALHLLTEEHFAGFASRDWANEVFLTPHAGEFAAAFGNWSGSKITAAEAAAERSGTTVVFKGPDTVIAGSDGATAVTQIGSKWLSTAGSGDVLAGAVAASACTIAAGDDAAAAVWMHSEAARRLGGSFLADDLARELSAVRAAL